MSLSYILPLILLLCCLSHFQEVAGRKEKRASTKGEAASYARAGQLSTKEKHACTWNINGDQVVSLVVSCTEPDNSSYQCTYEGEPQLCPAYSTKAKQYWKQILGRIKKMARACEEKTLKSRVCKKAPAAESQLTLVQKGTSAQAEKERGKGRKRGRAKETVQVPGAEPMEKGGKAGRREPSSKASQSPNPPTAAPTNLSTSAREVNDELSEFSEDLAETYCAEKWHSLCSFFVNFWNG
uniref:Fibroblast growth factor-binding protein 3 n=1 Tax=Geotrypetes seraphini TaxID=260995 RepID=A0A6P8RDY1_GEOSA|nr:fibroblast growth factor-binding protein 3 [Geotrypetes seraphini]